MTSKTVTLVLSLDDIKCNSPNTVHNPSKQVSIQMNSSRSNTNHLKTFQIGSLASQINPKRTSFSQKSKFHQKSITKGCPVINTWLGQRMMLVPTNKFQMQRSMACRTAKRSTLRVQDFDSDFRKIAVLFWVHKCNLKTCRSAAAQQQCNRTSNLWRGTTAPAPHRRGCSL